jgi:YD repeat-containing protein
MQLDNYIDEANITWTFIYDKNGNMTGKTNGTTNWEYRYNVSNQLIEVKKDGSAIGRYEYDTNGLRLKKTESDKTTYYIYNGQSILFEETFDVTDTVGKREYNIELCGMNLAKYTWDETNGWKLSYHLNDHLGSRQVVCDINGVITNNGGYATF